MINSKSQKELKKINNFIKSPNCPPIPQGVNPIAFGKICLENFINEQLDNEQELAYKDFYSPLPKKISNNYDLGTWQNG